MEHNLHKHNNIHKDALGNGFANVTHLLHCKLKMHNLFEFITSLLEQQFSIPEVQAKIKLF
jgi:hypothetical protein